MTNVASISDLATQYVKEALNGSSETKSANNGDVFSSLLASAMGMVKETQALTNAANAEKMNFSLGYSDNMHDLPIAQQKALQSLQYTVAIKNKVLEAYKEIMNMQI